MNTLFGLLVLMLLLIVPAANAPSEAFTQAYVPHEWINFEHVSNRQIQLNGVWTIPPDIVICDRVASEFRVRQAIRFWQRLGYSFGDVSSSNDPLDCRKEEIGKIKIMLPDSNTRMANNLAITNTERLVATGENIRATIVIHSFAVTKPLVLEHEIGHALGWQHSTRYGHLMNPEVERLGHDTSGIRNSDYLRIGQEIISY